MVYQCDGCLPKVEDGIHTLMYIGGFVYVYIYIYIKSYTHPDGIAISLWWAGSPREPTSQNPESVITRTQRLLKEESR